jgi:hypothetical protein
MQKTRIVLEVHHRREITNLADVIANRAYTLDGVVDVVVMSGGNTVEELQAEGFSLQEIALGAEGEVHRT